MFALHSKKYLVRQFLTLFAGQNAREWLLPHLSETALPRSVTATSAPLLEAQRLSSRQSSSFPYCRSSGRTLPHSYTVLIVATRHQFRRCPDGVCNTLTGQRVVVPHASGSCFRIMRSWRYRSRRSARRTGQGAAGGSSVDPDTAGRLWHPSCSPH